MAAKKPQGIDVSRDADSQPIRRCGACVDCESDPVLAQAFADYVATARQKAYSIAAFERLLKRSGDVLAKPYMRGRDQTRRHIRECLGFVK